MKKISLFLMLWSGVCVQAWSHEAPVPINKMQWVVDAGRLRIRFHSGASWWVLNILGDKSPPPLNWPAATQKEIKTYFDQHFILRADGKILPSQLVFCRYSEEVWRYYLGSQMDLEFSYALPPSVKILSGKATFYREENEERHETHVQIDGAPTRSALLTLDHPDFSFAFQDIVRPSAQRWRDAWVEGFEFWEMVPWLVLGFAAWQLQLRTRARRLFYYGGLTGTAATAASLTALMDPGSPHDWRPGPPDVWRAGLQSAGMTDAVGYGMGVFLFLMGIALVVEFGLRVYRGRLQRASESQADTLFTSQIRFVSLLLGGVTLLLMAQYVQKPA